MTRFGFFNRAEDLDAGVFGAWRSPIAHSPGVAQSLIVAVSAGLVGALFFSLVG